MDRKSIPKEHAAVLCMHSLISCTGQTSLLLFEASSKGERQQDSSMFCTLVDVVSPSLSEVGRRLTGHISFPSFAAFPGISYRYRRLIRDASRADKFVAWDASHCKRRAARSERADGTPTAVLHLLRLSVTMSNQGSHCATLSMLYVHFVPI